MIWTVSFLNALVLLGLLFIALLLILLLTTLPFWSGRRIKGGAAMDGGCKTFKSTIDDAKPDSPELKEALEAERTQCDALAPKIETIQTRSMRMRACEPLLSLPAIFRNAVAEGANGLGKNHFHGYSGLDQIFNYDYITRPKAAPGGDQSDELRRTISFVLCKDIFDLLVAFDTDWPEKDGNHIPTDLTKFDFYKSVICSARSYQICTENKEKKLKHFGLETNAPTDGRLIAVMRTLLQNETEIANAVIALAKIHGYTAVTLVPSGRNKKPKHQERALSMTELCDIAFVYVVKMRIRILNAFHAYIEGNGYLDFDLPPKAIDKRIQKHRHMRPWCIPRITDKHRFDGEENIKASTAAQYTDLISHILRARNSHLNQDITFTGQGNLDDFNKPVVYRTYMVDGQPHSRVGWHIYLMKGFSIIWPDAKQSLIRFSHIQRAPLSDMTIRHNGHMVRLFDKHHVIAYRENEENNDFFQFMTLDGNNRNVPYTWHYQGLLGQHTCFEAFDVAPRAYGVVSSPILLEVSTKHTERLRSLTLGSNQCQAVEAGVKSLETESSVILIETRSSSIFKTAKITKNGEQEIKPPLPDEDLKVLRTLLDHPQSSISEQIEDL